MTWNPPEADFQRTVVELALRRGWRIYHTFDARRSQPGFPDLTMVHSEQGRLVFAELKRNDGKLTTAQDEWQDALQAVEGVEVYIFRPSDWEVIEELLR